MFCYENAASNWIDDENFVLEMVSNDEDLLIDGEENDGSRGHDDDDHDIHGAFGSLHVYEGSVDDYGQSDDDHNDRNGSGFRICWGSVDNHGHNDDDYEDDDQTVSDEKGENNRGNDGEVKEIEGVDEVELYRTQEGS